MAATLVWGQLQASWLAAGVPCQHELARLSPSYPPTSTPPTPGAHARSSMVQQYLGLFEAASRLSQQPAAALLALMDLSSAAGGQNLPAPPATLARLQRASPPPPSRNQHK